MCSVKTTNGSVSVADLVGLRRASIGRGSALQCTAPLHSSAGGVLQLLRPFSRPGRLPMPVSAPTMSQLSMCLLQGAAVTQAFVLSGPGAGTAGNACEFRETNQYMTLDKPMDSVTCIAASMRAFGSNAQSTIASSAKKDFDVGRTAVHVCSMHDTRAFHISTSTTEVHFCTRN